MIYIYIYIYFVNTYIAKIQNSLMFNTMNLTILGKVAKLNSVYIFTL